MAGYVKIFSEIVDSSIWEEDPETCKVWITLLALCDCDGYVRGSPGWLAGKARVAKSVCESALQKFKSPDARSRTPDNDGRRIEQLEDGWLVLNYLAFRDRLSNDPKAVATRERVKKHRERYNTLRNTESVTSAVSASASVDASVGEGDCKGEGDFESAMKSVPVQLADHIRGHEAFARMVFDTWDSRDGKDGAGVSVRFAKHLQKRWNAEGEQWRNGCHTAQKKSKKSEPPQNCI